MNGAFIAKNSDYGQIREIWRNVFSDDEIYLNHVFENIMPNANSTIYITDNKIVSCITLIPIKYRIKHSDGSINILEGAYLYGVATLKEYRGKGIGAKLMDFSIKYCTENNYKFIVGISSESSLFEHYYKPKSWQKTGNCRQITKLNLSSVNIKDKYKQDEIIKITEYINNELLPDKHPKIFLFSNEIIKYNILIGEINNYMNNNLSELYFIEPMIMPLNGTELSTFDNAEFIFPC